MEKQVTKTKVYAGVVTIMLLATLTTAGILFDINGDLRVGFNQEKLKNEKLLSEKLLLDKKIVELKGEMQTLAQSNTELTQSWEMAKNKIAEQEKNLAQNKKQNNSLKKEVDGLRKLKLELEAELNKLRDSNKLLAQTNKNLEENLSAVKAENEALKEKLKNSAVLKASNFRVEVLRKNAGKLTVKARRTHQISISFDLPESAMASLGKSNVYLVITAPNGKPLADNAAPKKTIYTNDEKTEITPALTQEVNLNKNQRLTLTYSTGDVDLAEGLYKVELYTDNLYLGSNQFRLMK